MATHFLRAEESCLISNLLFFLVVRLERTRDNEGAHDHVVVLSPPFLQNSGELGVYAHIDKEGGSVDP